MASATSRPAAFLAATRAAARPSNGSACAVRSTRRRAPAPPPRAERAAAEAAEPLQLGAEQQGASVAAAPELQEAAAQSTAADQQQQQQPGRPQVDHYKLAGQRLRSLLNGVGDGEEELMNSMLQEQAPEEKLLLCLGAAAVVSLGASAVCWLCGLDPLGGASLSAASARAAAVGAAAAVPLVAGKALLWSDAARQHLPFMDDIHRVQVEELTPLVANLNTPQIGLLLAAEVVPGVLILLPACTGGIAKSLELWGGMFSGGALDIPTAVPTALALCATSVLAAAGKIGETSISEEEYGVVRDALDNADRFYRVMASGRDTSPLEPQRAADAFRAVALTWLARNQVAARFAAVVGGCEVLYLGLLWQATGDLSAPMVAALSAAAVDFGNIRRLSAPSTPNKGSRA